MLKLNNKGFAITGILYTLLVLFLLILVLIPGIGTVRNGSRSWFGIGGFGIQPSEFTKLALIMFTSRYLTEHNKMLPIIFITLSIFGIIMLQPDFGTGTILVMTIFGILFINGIINVFKTIKRSVLNG